MTAGRKGMFPGMSHTYLSSSAEWSVLKPHTQNNNSIGMYVALVEKIQILIWEVHVEGLRERLEGEKGGEII